MNNTNKVIEIGHLVRDAELAYTPSGAACLSFSIAVNESRKNGDEWTDYPNYFDCKLWGKSAENLKAYALKGKQVCVTGRLHQDRWEKDGRNNSRVLINCDELELLGGKSDGETRPAQQRAPREPADAELGEDFPEGIPF